jgi:hypothetical protein
VSNKYEAWRKFEGHNESMAGEESRERKKEKRRNRNRKGEIEKEIGVPVPMGLVMGTCRRVRVRRN